MGTVSLILANPRGLGAFSQYKYAKREEIIIVYRKVTLHNSNNEQEHEECVLSTRLPHGSELLFSMYSGP